MNASFWRGRKVFLTGHTGFKGSWLACWLHALGAEVTGFALAPSGQENLFTLLQLASKIHSIEGDVRDKAAVQQAMQTAQPEIVIHMAAQALVRPSYLDPITTYETNVMGLINVFEAIRTAGSVKAVINVTSDKCYENREWAWGYREDEAMGGYDPYSSSKGCAELVSAAWRRSYFAPTGIGLATARAGNVIGGGDWAVDRLVPDTLQALSLTRDVIIRNPHAIRPWQHVLEPLSGYLQLAEQVYAQPTQYAEGWNFGPADSDAKPVSWIVDQLCQLWGGGKWVLDQGDHPHEAHYLKLDCSKSKAHLGWTPRWSLEESLEKIVAWHQAYLAKEDMSAVTLEQINCFMNELR